MPYILDDSESVIDIMGDLRVRPRHRRAVRKRLASSSKVRIFVKGKSRVRPDDVNRLLKETIEKA